MSTVQMSSLWIFVKYFWKDIRCSSITMRTEKNGSNIITNNTLIDFSVDPSVNNLLIDIYCFPLLRCGFPRPLPISSVHLLLRVRQHQGPPLQRSVQLHGHASGPTAVGQLQRLLRENGAIRANVWVSNARENSICFLRKTRCEDHKVWVDSNESRKLHTNGRRSAWWRIRAGKSEFKKKNKIVHGVRTYVLRVGSVLFLQISKKKKKKRVLLFQR